MARPLSLQALLRQFAATFTGAARRVIQFWPNFSLQLYSESLI
jgi:hypothetical protein